MGDIILTTPIFRSLKQSRPELAIDVVTSPTAAPILDHNPNLRRVWQSRSVGLSAHELTLVRQLRREQYDVIVDLCHRANPMRLLKMRLLGDRYRVFLRHKNSESKRGSAETWNVYDKIVEADNSEHFAKYQASCLSIFGIETSDERYEIFTGMELQCVVPDGTPPSLRVLLNVGGKRRSNSLSFDQTRHVLRTIRQEVPGAIIFFNAHNVHWFAQKKEELQREAGGIVVLTRITVSDLVSRVKSADLVVTTDTGTCHVATAVGAKQIILSSIRNAETQRFLPSYGWYRHLSGEEAELPDAEILTRHLRAALASAC